jgi:hypothetical protein
VVVLELIVEVVDVVERVEVPTIEVVELVVDVDEPEPTYETCDIEDGFRSPQ